MTHTLCEPRTHTLSPTARIDSPAHPLAASIRRLLTREGRAAQRRFIIDDEENIVQALRASVTLVALFHTGASLPQRLAHALPPDLTVYEVSSALCKKLFGNEKSARLFAIAECPTPLPLSALTPVARDIVALESPSIMGNAGALIRSALALGVGAVVLLDTHPADLYDRRLIRASRGYLFALPVVAAPTSEFLRFTRRNGLPLLVTAPTGDTPLSEIAALPRPLAIVFGNEKEGCSPALMAAASYHVAIPTRAQVESLNVSVAAGITLYTRLHFNTAQPTVAAQS